MPKFVVTLTLETEYVDRWIEAEDIDKALDATCDLYPKKKFQLDCCCDPFDIIAIEVEEI